MTGKKREIAARTVFGFSVGRFKLTTNKDELIEVCEEALDKFVKFKIPINLILFELARLGDGEDIEKKYQEQFDAYTADSSKFKSLGMEE